MWVWAFEISGFATSARELEVLSCLLFFLEVGG